MSKALRGGLQLALVGCLLPLQLAWASEGTRGNLATAPWLEKNLQNSSILVLDTSAAKLYAAQHIPGAVNVDIYLYGVQEKPVAEMEKLCQSWGISPGKKLVIYDPGAGMMATKLFHTLEYYGFPAKQMWILDGGLAKWQEAGLPVTKDPTPAPQRGSFTIKKLNEEVRVWLPEFLAASGDAEHNALVDALGPDWHFGEVAPFDRAGHIPHGILLPSADFYNPDKTFKSPEELARMLTYLGIRPEQKIYTYCGGGVAASVPYFALKYILNYPNVKLYKESEMGWLQDDRELPYWTYDAPALMRRATWLQSWGGQRMRMFGVSRPNILDVRPASDFEQGHVPFALNVSGDLFRNNLATPDKLAALLGPAGVDPSYEAVVVSGAGLTKDAALAFLMLEKLGQKNVSVYLDPADRWAQLGFAVTKDPTVVGAPKGPLDPSIPPATYTPQVRKDVIIADPQATRGVYPKVFIASGANVPAKTPDAKFVHVPYTDLLNADGTPKPAKEIWSVLSKAGVPRYAELVCFADDPGEAAVNYFILKLMGFPDVKVLTT